MSLAPLRSTAPCWLEAVRSCAARWPFERGSTRLARVLGQVARRTSRFPQLAQLPNGVVAIFSEDEAEHEAYWLLYERWMQAVLIRWLQPGDVFVDVGAHRGWHTAFALGLVGTQGIVVACEPYPQHVERLRILASLNPRHRLDVVRTAVGDAIGHIDLHACLEAGFDTVHTVVPEHRDLFAGKREVIRCPLTTLDQLMSNMDAANISPEKSTVVKIDVEGAELQVLQGALTTLRSGRVKALLLELTLANERLRDSSEECRALLGSLGWTTQIIAHDGRLHLWKQTLTTNHVDVLATPPALKQLRTS